MRAANSQLPSHLQHLVGGANLYSIDSEAASGAPHRVVRRFDNLVTLHESIKSNYRGCVIPGRPAKTAVNSSAARGHGERFLSERAHDIEAYLTALASHVEMRHSEV